MNHILKIGKLLVLFLVFNGLSSCQKDDNEAPFTMIAEVATVKRMINDEVNYARMYYAYGTQPMSSVKVTLAEGGLLNLTSSDASKRTWYMEPELSDFSSEMPTLGEYVFTVVNEDIEHTFTDELGNKGLGFPVISGLTAKNGMITIDWVSLANAKQYKIIVRNDQNEIHYSGPLLESIAKKFEVSRSTGLSKDLVPGETYKVELMAFIYEDNTTSENYLFNVEEISITSQSVLIE